MPSFTINIPIRNADADDVKAAFASAYGYNATIMQGNGISVANPLSQEQFVQQCCINFMLDITKKYNFPIVFDFPAGHIHENNTLIFGKKVSLEVNDKETTLKY